MLGLLRRYTRWLHTGWPAGTVEKLPEVWEDGSTAVDGLYVVGDLTGIPLLKFSADTGARAVQTIIADGAFQRLREASGGAGEQVLDLVVIGGGVSGMAAALEAKKHGLTFALLEATEPFSTVVNFPKGKPIYTYPTEMVPTGDLQFTAQVKEPLVEEMKAQTLGQGIEPVLARAEAIERRGNLLEVLIPKGENLLARRVVVGIGRSGNFRKLGVPGEDLDKVSNRLHDPQDYTGQDVLVVGGGDSALETAIALAQSGARVSLSYRKPEFARPKPANVEALEALAEDPLADVAVEEPVSERVTTSTGRYLKKHIREADREKGSLTLYMASTVKEITEDEVVLDLKDGQETLANQAVFSMIGREAPLEFFRRSGVPIRGERSWGNWTALALILAAFFCLYSWKSGGYLSPGAKAPAVIKDNLQPTFPKKVHEQISGWGDGWKSAVEDRTSVVGTVVQSMRGPSFYYTALYCLVMGIFGWRRIRRRKTPYVTVQTTVLFLVQLFPLFLLPEVILPYGGYNGWYESGPLKTIANSLFPLYGGYTDTNFPSWGHPRAYWHAYGLILAWPLNVYQVFYYNSPQWGWLGISFVQTFVIIPLLIWRWGKGAYCGWICSCGGMAETLGDTLREKMPHGPRANRLNMIGQVLLGVAFLMLALRIVSWVYPKGDVAKLFNLLFTGAGATGAKVPAWKGIFAFLNWKWFVDVFMAGVLGLGLYFHFSGRTWCRFACPLAALMHIYARFSRFRIFAEKKKCISCNVCTSVCHQGIDIMNFANKGLPMEDPECVRCSACVQSCPTGVLQFGRIDPKTGAAAAYDPLPASPVRMREAKALPVVS